MQYATQFLGVANNVLKASLLVFVHGSKDRIIQSRFNHVDTTIFLHLSLSERDTFCQIQQAR